jgi:hypothetical protein
MNHDLIRPFHTKVHVDVGPFPGEGLVKDDLSEPVTHSPPRLSPRDSM